ncbi:Phosphoenolpyruvate/pyruvate domain-containing protein [Calycina marina]|uniref:Phosphoenolpyruvate/pyruvate domain-containing protein n=1 Tax=Calycina marina TaxID=1763456 RepID=A0A9P7Z064_9HELO|nr:Phosphoenolpyruvate/pyruvate domain-containing protein [Calycina marina]
MSIKPQSGATRLRELLKDPKKMVVAPGVFDGISARLAIAAGFEAIYMTGAGTSMSRLGWADLGMATLNDMAANAGMIAGLDRSIPVIADADTGYGGPIMVTRTVEAYVRAGIAGMHLEDQVQQKRCGHLLGKEIVDRDIYATRIRAAVNARNAMGSDMLIIARTDSRQTYGFDEAVARLKEAVTAGADVVFLEAAASKEECENVVKIFHPVPCMLNMVPKGVTPDMSIKEAEGLGFRIMIFPALTFEASMAGSKEALRKLKDNGTQPLDNSAGMKEAFSVCGLAECIAIDKAAGGRSFEDVHGSL